jgi:hypothetical protein
MKKAIIAVNEQDGLDFMREKGFTRLKIQTQ